jgi:hypothetical protein
VRPMKWEKRHRARAARTFSAGAVLAILLTTLSGIEPAPGYAQSITSADNVGLFTEAQALQGRKDYVNHCIACHGFSMQRLFAKYPTAAAYYNFISGSMPRHAAGSLEEEYLNILAYMLQEAGFPPGENELSTDRSLLSQIIPANGQSR